MLVGWHYVEDSDVSEPLGAATYLNVGGYHAAKRSPKRLKRMYFKGAPDVLSLALMANGLDPDADTQFGNELNHPIEQYPGTPDTYRAEYRAFKKLVKSRVFWQPPSLGFPGWQEWLNGAEEADGICLHCYGSLAEMQAIVVETVLRFPGKSIWIAECNFGPAAGKYVDLDDWAVNHLRPFLDWCAASVPEVEAVTYFAFAWPNADSPQGTPVDGAGTAVERVLREWREPMDTALSKGLTCLDTTGRDIGPWLAEAAARARIPVVLALAAVKAESGLNPKAERWGKRTQEALAAIGAGGFDALQAIINDVWPDVSFGFSQRIALYHYAGDRTATVSNCLNIRQYVFDHPKEDIGEMCGQLSNNLAAARQADLSPVDGDELLGALVAYNAGHIPQPDSGWWLDWVGNVASYSAALTWATKLVKEVEPMDEATKAKLLDHLNTAWGFCDQADAANQDIIRLAGDIDQSVAAFRERLIAMKQELGLDG